MPVAAKQLAGTPLLLITSVPQQIVPGGTSGVTLINPGEVAIDLSTDQVPTESNTFQLAPNGASLPIASGPLFASASNGMGQLIVFPKILNVFNPNVLTAPPESVVILPVTGNNLGGGLFTYTATDVPQNAKTLLIQVDNGAASVITNVKVVGQTYLATGGWAGANPQPGLGFSYTLYNAPPYLQADLGSDVYFIVVPLHGVPLGGNASFSLLRIAVTSSSTPNVAIWTDTNEYTEDIYYNGTMQSAAAIANNSTALVLTGPARLLTASLSGSVGTSTSQLLLNDGSGNTPMLTQFNAGNLSVSFPENTILQQGATISVFTNTANSAEGNVTYAYP